MSGSGVKPGFLINSSIVCLSNALIPEVGSFMVFPVTIFIAVEIRLLPNILIDLGFFFVTNLEPIAILQLFTSISFTFTILNKLKGIKNVYFESNEVLAYNICEKLAKCNSIKFVSANYIPSYMFEMLDKYNIIPESRDEVLFTSNFMQINSLSNYATIFYKYMIYLEFPFTKEDMDDFMYSYQVGHLPEEKNE